MGFTKLDEGILKSSIMGETAEVFKVWIAFLASCGPDGIARVTAIFLSGVCHFPIDIVRLAIERLEAPDPDSRTEKEEGRRIIKVEGGWFIVNYEKYRSFSNSESPGAVRTRKWRERKMSEGARLFKEEEEGQERHRDVTDCTVTSRSASASASASKEKEEPETVTSRPMTDEQIEEKFAEFWTSWPQEGKHAKEESRKKFRAICKRGRMMELSDACRGYAEFLTYQKDDKNFDQRPLYAKTFLNGQWEEYIGFKRKPRL